MTFHRLGSVCRSLRERWELEAQVKRAEHKAEWRRTQLIAGQITWAVLSAAGARVDLSEFLPTDSDESSTTLDEIQEDLEAKGLRGSSIDTEDPD